MTERPGILAIDQGTTSSRAIVFDTSGTPVASAQMEFEQLYPSDGWVEHDPKEIWSSTLEVTRKAFAAAEATGTRVEGLAITNQRETTVVWDRRTGEPVYNAIVWQDRRTAEECRRLERAGDAGEVASRTGLLLDPYFSATKMAWILDHVEGARARAAAGDLACGTGDSWLLWNLTSGRVFATDATNASRTSLCNIHDVCWDQDLLETFRVPLAALAEIRDCTADYGMTEPALLGRAVPIAGVAGDQQSAAIGQCCFTPGSIKSTYGTGCFVLLNTGTEAVRSSHRLLSTIAYRLDGETTYALEGSIFVSGAAVQWLRDSLGLVETAAETEGLARGLRDNHGVYLVPAFTGLGAPHWDPDARGALFGLTRDTGVPHITRATLESVAYQTRDLLRAMSDDGVRPTELRVDGGMVRNGWLMQFLADVLGVPVDRPRVDETTALGAAFLAGLQLGLHDSLEDLTSTWQRDRRFEPSMEEAERSRLLAGWDRAVNRVRGSDPAAGQ